MYRCASVFFAAALALILSSFSLPSMAQLQRNFPSNALRGELVVGDIPDVKVNGAAGRFSPGARIRGQNNILLLLGGLVGSRYLVHYTLDMAGEVKDVWVLTSEEAAKQPWPSTLLESERWQFDSSAQTWSKP
jgi:hypothetical protein